MIDLSDIAHKLPVKFYSNDVPENVYWPYILVHTNDYDKLFRLKFEHTIIDIHVHRFRKVGDYPIAELINYAKLIKKLANKFKDRITFVLPDRWGGSPSPPGSCLLIHLIFTVFNTMKTLGKHTLTTQCFLKLLRNCIDYMELRVY